VRVPADDETSDDEVVDRIVDTELIR